MINKLDTLVAAAGLPEFPTLIQILKEHPLLESWVHFLVFWEDVIFSAFIACLISIIFYLGVRQRRMIPTGLQNFVELIVDNLRSVIRGVLGPQGDEHVPFLGTLFIYIFFMNAFGLIPFMKSPSSSLSISIGMALCVFGRVQYLNVKNMGLGGYIYHMCGSPKDALGWMIAPLMLPIEIITQISRPVTLALRLTGNLMGEHVLVGIFTLFALAIFSFEYLPIGLPVQLPAMLFGLLMSFLQAMVFTLLSTVYILLSIPHAEDH